MFTTKDVTQRSPDLPSSDCGRRFYLSSANQTVELLCKTSNLNLFESFFALSIRESQTGSSKTFLVNNSEAMSPLNASKLPFNQTARPDENFPARTCEAHQNSGSISPSRLIKSSNLVLKAQSKAQPRRNINSCRCSLSHSKYYSGWMEFFSYQWDCRILLVVFLRQNVSTWNAVSFNTETFFWGNLE